MPKLLLSSLLLLLLATSGCSNLRLMERLGCDCDCETNSAGLASGQSTQPGGLFSCGICRPHLWSRFTSPAPPPAAIPPPNPKYHPVPTRPVFEP